MPSREQYIRRKYNMTVEEYEAKLVREVNVKTCRKCKVEKPLDDFDVDPRNTGNIGKGRATYCKTCSRAKEKAWRGENPQYVKDYQKEYYQANKEGWRTYWLMKSYGVTPEWYDTTLAAQGGGCKICGAKEAGGNGGFHVDHVHIEGWAQLPPEEKRKYIRGLLCHACNTMLTEHLEKNIVEVAKYLRASPVLGAIVDSQQ